MTKAGETNSAADRADLVSISHASDLLTESGDVIDRSALSRYCDTHSLKRGKVPGIRGVAVSLSEVKRHRAANYTREVMSGGRTVTAESDAAPKPAPRASASIEPIPAADDPTRRKRSADADLAELNLAKAKGELTAIIDVDAGLADALANLRQSAATQAKTAAHAAIADLGLGPDKVRALQVSFKNFYRGLEGRFIDDMAILTASAVEPRSRARQRLETLAAEAARLRSVASAASEARA